jgi:uncharacterized membrane protein YeaQ/YmgE (transglycosylase-associated protein family)
MISTIIGIIIVGLIAGAIARLVIPGKQDIGIPMTIGIGIVGSFLGGFLGYLLHHDKAQGAVQTSGWIGSIIGAIIVLFLYLRFGPGRSIAR